MESRLEELSGLIAGEAGTVPLAGVRVTGDVLGRGARVRVAQRFRNGEAQAVEAVYKFPLPEGAAVCGFEARIGERRIHGSVEEREKAFEIYDQALADGHGGYLLEEERPNIFTLSVGNLPPGAEALVQINYVTLLDADRGEARFVLPTTIAPRYLPEEDAEEEGIPVAEALLPPYAGEVPYGLSLELRLHQSDSIGSIESPSHTIRVEPGRPEEGLPARVSLTAESARMDRDFVLVLGFREPRPSRAWMVRDEQGAFLQLDLSPPPEAEGQQPEASNRREVLFLLDCSGSMQGDSIAEARRALAVCLKALAPGQRFNLIRFGSTFECLFPDSREYGEGSLQEALRYLQRVDADLGGTELLGPLRYLYGRPPAEGVRREVVLLTDGEVGNEAEAHALVRGHRESARFFAVGIGMGPNEHLVRGIARAGGGAAEFIHPGERIEPKMLRLFQKLAGRRLEAPEVRLAGAAAQVAPAEAAIQPGSPCTLFALFARAAGGFSAESAEPQVLATAKADGEEWRWVVPVTEAAGEGAGPAGLPVPVLWARERIRSLEEGAEALAEAQAARGSRRNRPRPQARREGWREETVRLSKEYGILSRSTSFVAVEERPEAEGARGEAGLRKVPVLVTEGWHGGAGRAAQSMAAPAAAAMPPRLTAPAKFHRTDVRMEASDSPFGVVSKPAKRFVPAPVEDRTDLLLLLLDLQRAEGGFELSPQAAARLGIDLGEIAAAARQAEIGGTEAADEAKRLRLLHTALVLRVLETRFAPERSTWSGLVAKSREWLDRLIASGRPRVAGKELADWAAGFEERQVRPVLP